MRVNICVSKVDAGNAGQKWLEICGRSLCPTLDSNRLMMKATFHAQPQMHVCLCTFLPAALVKAKRLSTEPDMSRRELDVASTLGTSILCK